MKNATMVRDRVMRRAVDMLEHLRIQLSMLPEVDRTVLGALERPQQFDLGERLSNFLMGELGQVSAPKEARFNKTRRALVKKNPEADRRGKRRGVLSDEDKAILSGAAPAEE